jgi:hypothetical protein
MTHMLLMLVHVHNPYASYDESPYVATFHTDSTESDKFIAPEKKGSHLDPQHVS